MAFRSYNTAYQNQVPHVALSSTSIFGILKSIQDLRINPGSGLRRPNEIEMAESVHSMHFHFGQFGHQFGDVFFIRKGILRTPESYRRNIQARQIVFRRGKLKRAAVMDLRTLGKQDVGATCPYRFQFWKNP